MSDSHLATLCLFTSAECSLAFRRGLDRLLKDTLPRDIEVRLGVPSASPNLHYALGRLCSDGPALDHARRFHRFILQEW